MAFGGGSSEIEGGSGRAGCGATQLRSGESDGSDCLNFDVCLLAEHPSLDCFRTSMGLPILTLWRGNPYFVWLSFAFCNQ